jgi:hypothetical protein
MIETAKEHFDKYTKQGRYETVNYYATGNWWYDEEPVEKRFKYITEAITSDRRYDRNYSVLLQDVTDNSYWIAPNCYKIGGDGEYRGFSGSIEPISNEDAETFIRWCKLKFVG